jgi:MFS superfamily sulfate permease-like transporter
MDQRITPQPDPHTPATPGQTPEVGRNWLALFKSDFLSSIVVFLVALPLCMGIANACGVPPALGLITGIVGGIVVGFLAGCPLQVSGPAAGLVVVVVGIVKDTPELLGVIVLGAGVVQIVAGLCKLGQWFRAVSPAVVEGMLAGIGVLIFASQFHVMVDDKPREDGIKNLLSIPEAVYKGVVPHTPEEDPTALEKSMPNHRHAAQIGLLTIVVLVLWKGLMPKRVQFLPAPLVAIVVATLTCYLLGYEVHKVPMPDNLASAVTWPSAETLVRMLDKSVLVMIFTVAFVASAETLLCATAVDQLHSGPRTKYDKELWAQGVGNVLCGLLGALPMTGVIVRSATNVEAGARTRLSAILHGFWLLLMVVLGTALLAQIPTAALAAVLVYTGYKLVKLGTIRELWQWGWSEVAIYFCTLFGVVTTGLLEGVLIGVMLSVIKLLYRFSHLSIRLEEDAANQRTVLYVEGAATFLRLPQLAAALEKVPPATELHVHFEKLTYIDHACLELLMTWEKQHEALGGGLVIDWELLHAKFHAEPNGKKPTNGRSSNGHAESSEAITKER